MMAFMTEHPQSSIDEMHPGLARSTAEHGPQPTDVPWYLDPREILLVLRLRRLLVLLPAAILVALVLGALFILPAQYTASTQLLIDPHGVQVVKDDLNPPSQTSDASLLLVDSEMLVLSSDDVLRQVVDRFGLDRDPEFAGRASVGAKVVEAVSGLLGLPHAPADPKLAALRSLRERLAVQRVERSFVLSLSVTTDSRDLSARLAQAIAETYLAVEAASRADMASRAGKALTARLGELQAAVRDAEDRAQAFKTANNLVGTRTQLVSEQQLGQIGDQLGAARAKAAEQQARLNQIEAALKGGGSLNTLPEVLQSVTVAQLRAQLAQSERVVADISGTLGPRHPSMIAAQAQLKASREQLDAEIRRIATSLRNEHKATTANVAALSRSMNEDKSEAVSVGDAMVRLRELERQIEARRSVYETFLIRARQLQEQQQVGTSASRIISPATPPAHRKGPPALVILAAALAAGLGLGIGCALLAERMAGRVRTSRRLAQRLGLGVLGALPPPEASQAEFRFSQPAGQGAVDGGKRYDLAVARLNDQLERVLATARTRVLVVTAADRVSGKSLLALQLAAMGAAEHDRALLVDADPDTDMMTEFHLPVAPVPTKIKDGRAVVPETRLLDFPGLRFLSAGRGGARFNARAAAETILGRAEDLDLVVINAGVLGADLFTDRLIKDARVSLVLLAVSAAQSTFASIERALPALARDRSPVCVLTEASALDA